MLYEMCTFLPFNNVPVVYTYIVIKKCINLKNSAN